MLRGTTEAAHERLVACSRLVGHAFCRSLVGALAETLSVPTVLLATVDDPSNPRKARTIAVWSNGALAPNMEYDLPGSPCSNVLDGTPCVYPDDAIALFPEDTLLAEMGARGYMGSPLVASDGRTIGLLAAISDKPLDPDPRLVSILEIFAGRAAAELEREDSISRSEYLGRLVEGSASEIYVFDADTLRFALVNQGARENLGYSMLELQALTPLDLKPDFTRQAFLDLIEPLSDGRIPFLTFRTRHRRKDGSTYPVEVRLQQIRGLGAPVYFAAIEDITKRAEIEADLHETEARLQRLFTQSPAGIVETDQSGRMTLVNKTWCDMLGYTESELVGRTVFDVTHPDSLLSTQQAIQKLVDGAEGIVVEKNYVRKDGRIVPASSNVSALRAEDGTFLGVAAVVLDVTERLEADRKLRESEARLRKTIDGALAFIGVLAPDGTLLEANATALHAGGVARDEVIGRKFWDCYWWSYDPEVAKRLEAAIARAANGASERYDEVVRMQGDTRMTIDFMVSPVFAADGSVEFLVPSGFDISERKRQETLVTTLMREVNHRSKNLLAVVQSIARRMPKDSVEKFNRDFSERLQALAACQELLTRTPLDDVPLSALIRSQLMHFADLLGQRIAVNGPDIQVSASAAQTLGMAIYELTTNAAKYGSLSNDRGLIAINWSVDGATSGEPRFQLTWSESGGPAVTDVDRVGFGSFVIGRLVETSLRGECQRLLEPEGLRWHFSCPLANLQAE